MRYLLALFSACLLSAGATAWAEDPPAAKEGDAKPAVKAEAGEKPAAETAPAAAEAKPTTGTKPASDGPGRDPHAHGDAAHAKDEHSKAAHGKDTPAKDGHGEAGHDAAHGHDTTDLSHGNPSAMLHKPEEMRFDLAIASFIIFVLLLAILTKFAWGPIVAGLDAREKSIADRIEQAKLAAERAEAQLKSYEAKLAAANEESRQLVAQARRDAEAAKEKIVSEAQAIAQREREKAVEDITAAKNGALREIAEKSVETAISLARNIVRREVKPEDHDSLITDALGQFSKLN